MLTTLFGFVTAPIVFPLAYLLRSIPLVRNKILWIYYDDEDEFGFDVDWWMQDKPRNFWTAYKWSAIRNPAWNLQAYWRLDYNDSLIPLEGDDITCVLKYVDSNGKYMDNKGPILSLKHSITGDMWFRFQLNGLNYWRYSFADMVFADWWIELQIGFTTRATFRFKIKRITKIFEI